MSRFTRWRARQKAKKYLESFKKVGEVKKVCSENSISSLSHKGLASYERISLYVAPSASVENVRNTIKEHQKFNNKI